MDEGLLDEERKADEREADDENVITKEQLAEENANYKVQDYVSGDWIFELIPGRLYCGPRPTRQIQGYHLTQKLHVTHLVNILPSTTNKTMSGAPSDVWYSVWWKDFAPEKRPVIVRDFKIVEDTVRTMKDPTPFYAKAAREIIAPMMRANPDGVFYIHNQSGHEEEAILAMLVWNLVDGASFPDDLDAWFETKNRRRMLDDPLQREQLVASMDMTSSGGGGATTTTQSKAGNISGFLTRTPREKKLKTTHFVYFFSTNTAKSPGDHQGFVMGKCSMFNTNVLASIHN